jgi:hypothetical protein
MQIIFDTYRVDAKDFTYCKVIDDDHSEDMNEPMPSAATNKMWEYKKAKRRAACEKLIFEYCIMSDKCLNLYGLDSYLDIMRWFQNTDLLNTLLRDMIFAMADVFCQHITYQDACMLIEMNDYDSYEPKPERENRIPHSERYCHTERIGLSAMKYFEMREAMQNPSNPCFDTTVLARWNKYDEIEKRFISECNEITGSHLQMIEDILNNGSTEDCDVEMIKDIRRKLVMAIAAEYNVIMPNDVIEKLISLDGIMLSESEKAENKVLIESAIIGKEAMNWCSRK